MSGAVLAAIFAFALQSPQAQNSSPEVLSLDDSLRIARTNAFSIRNALAQKEIDRQKVLQGDATLAPSITSNATYTRYDRRVSGGIVQSKNSSVTLSVPIDVTGVYTIGVKAAAAALKSSTENVNTVLNDLKRDVRNAYYQVAQAKENVTVAESTLGAEKERLGNVQKQFDVGVLAKVDVIRQQVQVSNAQSNLISSQNSLQIAKESFNNALGRPVETPFDIVGVGDLPQIDPDPVRYFALAQRNRPELKKLRYDATTLHFETRYAEKGLLPSLNLSGTFQHNWNPSFYANGDEAFATVLLTVPIFDYGSTRALVKQNRQIEVQNQVAIDQTTLAVSLDVRQALTNLENAKSRIETNQEQVRLAEESYRLSVVKLNAGQGTILEEIDAQNDLTRAKTSLVSSRYDYLTAYAALQRAVADDDPAKAVVEPVNPPAKRKGKGK